MNRKLYKFFTSDHLVLSVKKEFYHARSPELKSHNSIILGLEQTNYFFYELVRKNRMMTLNLTMWSNSRVISRSSVFFSVDPDFSYFLFLEFNVLL